MNANIIKGLKILEKYTHRHSASAVHGMMIVAVMPLDVSKRDKANLLELGFFPGRTYPECFEFVFKP